MYHNNVTFELLTVNDSPVTEYHHNSRTYVEGRKGSEYKIRIKNNNYFNVLVVPSVDGLSVMNGKPADYKSSGYILYPYETIVIDGWRTDLMSVRKFIFTRKNKSYSAKTEQGTNNLGVIGLAVFREKPRLTYTFTSNPIVPHKMIPDPSPNPWPCPNQWYSSTNIIFGSNQGSEIQSSMDSCSAPTGSTMRGSKKGLSNEPAVAMAAAAPAPTVGTGMGNKKDSKVVTAAFDRNDRPYLTMQLFYYERKQLEKMGIVQSHKVSEPQRPNPFPEEQHPMQFCKEV